MASSIALLNLCDCFDTVYGSSAGSIIGAYMISRQMCVDVYSDVLVGNKLFLQKPEIIKFAAKSWTGRKNNFNEGFKATGMNITYVLRDVMSSTGLRPFDFDSFAHNVETQKLYVLSSGENFNQGIFGPDDFFDRWTQEDGVTYNYRASENDPRGMDSGFFSCLASSMVVPGAGGPPITLSKKGEKERMYCDAFVYEAIPIRAPVYNSNATHVVALRTRPQAAKLKTSPGFYETKIAKYYFEQCKMDDVAKWYSAGGQQFRYVEEVACTFEGLGGEEVLIPPTDVVYARPDLTWGDVRDVVDVKKWRKAYVMPIMVGEDVQEMSPLEQKEKVVVKGIRDGFIAGFETLKDAAGVELEDGMTSADLAELLFPFREDLGPEYSNGKAKKPSDLKPIYVKGLKINSLAARRSLLFKARTKRNRVKRLISRRYRKAQRLLGNEKKQTVDEKWETIKRALPAVEDFPHLARQVRRRIEKQEE
ncbi:hypothetical protein TrVE_jg5991 [Triparma verrucosa]|uniref:PNPLA domain-containing protein n=1 Tax=Triparma verrucosa TaxID=1606542 RepID=A0A9W7BGK1_9STRA|nr:hypothetical protein TrVE_jg5991 [Triparma verrucosa]